MDRKSTIMSLRLRYLIMLSIIVESIQAIGFVLFTSVVSYLIDGVMTNNVVLINKALYVYLPACCGCLLIAYPLSKSIYIRNAVKKINTIRTALIEKKLLDKTLNLDYTNKLLNNFNMDLNEFENGIIKSIPGIVNLLVMGLYSLLVIYLKYDWLLTMVALLSGAVGFLGYKFVRKNTLLEKNINFSLREYKNKVSRIYENRMLIKMFPFYDKFVTQTNELIENQKTSLNEQAKNDTYFQILFFLSDLLRIVGIVFISVWFFGYEIGTITSLLLLVSRVSMLAGNYSENMINVKKIRIAIEAMAPNLLMEVRLKENSEMPCFEESAPLYSVKNLSVSYDDHVVISDLSFEIASNSLTLIHGNIGTGKSTLIKVLCGFKEYINGSLKFMGVELNTIEQRALQPNLAYSTQSSILFSGTILENITMFEENPDFNRVYQLIEKLRLDADNGDIENFLARRVQKDNHDLSGGQIQKIAFCRALYFDRDVIILDEPFSALDQESLDEIVRLIYELVNEKSIIIVTHKKMNALKYDYEVELEAS